MAAAAAIESIQEAVSDVTNLQLTDEQVKTLVKHGVAVGWRNLGKVLKGWNAEEIKSGKKQPAGTPPPKPVKVIRKPKRKE